MKCICQEWAQNIAKVDAPRMFMAARNPETANYDGIPFRYCPWCAKYLIEDAVAVEEEK
jgi:hypothetical protein